MHDRDPQWHNGRRARCARPGGQRALLAVVTVVASLSGLFAADAAAAVPLDADAAGCPQLIFYYSRGSGQTLGPDPAGLGSPGLALYAAVRTRFGALNVASMANTYPAAPVSSYLSGRYTRSVAAGVTSELRNIDDLMGICPTSDLLLAGFSQGAQVTRVALARLSESEQHHVTAVVLFGDPYFSASEAGVTVYGGFTPRQVGILRQFRPKTTPAIPSAFGGKVFTWCHPADSVCQGLHRGNGKASHSTYGTDAQGAVAAIAARVSRAIGQYTGATYSISGTCVTQLCAVAIYSGPGATSFEKVGAAYEGEPVSISCQAEGEPVTGANGITSAIWDRLSGGGFVSDFYVTTPLVGEFSAGVTRCQNLSVAAP